MGLDTDDIVALSINIPLIVIAIVLTISLFFMKSPKIRKELNRMLLQKENSNKPLLEIVYGSNDYALYLNDIRNDAIAKYNESPLAERGIPWTEAFKNEEALVTAYIEHFIRPSRLWHSIDDKLTSKGPR